MMWTGHTDFLTTNTLITKSTVLSRKFDSDVVGTEIQWRGIHLRFLETNISHKNNLFAEKNLGANYAEDNVTMSLKNNK